MFLWCAMPSLSLLRDPPCTYPYQLIPFRESKVMLFNRENCGRHRIPWTYFVPAYGGKTAFNPTWNVCLTGMLPRSHPPLGSRTNLLRSPASLYQTAATLAYPRKYGTTFLHSKPLRRAPGDTNLCQFETAGESNWVGAKLVMEIQ